MTENETLEREAIALYQSIPAWARSAAMKDFMYRLAVFLNWQQMKEIIK